MIKYIIFFSLIVSTTNSYQSVYAQSAKAELTHGSLILIDTLLAQNIKKDNLSSGGGSIGGFGGGDSVDRRRLAAWFYGSSPINVCYQLNSSFGLNETQVTTEINKAIYLWTNYFQDKKINALQAQPINTNFKLLNRCNGGEDLVIYLGTGPIHQNLLDLKAFQSLSNPVAYANKTHASEDYMWSKGYIRFVESFSYSLEDTFYPQWDHQHQFSQILIHEIGHILGFVHIPETIMSGSIVKDVLVENKSYNDIDDHKELIYCNDCEHNYFLTKSEDNKIFDPTTKISFLNQTLEINTEQNTEIIIPTNIIKKENPSPLISIFHSENSTNISNHIYFIKYRNLDLTLVIEDFSMTAYKDGIILATFERKKQ